MEPFDWPGKGQASSEGGHVAKNVVEQPFLSKELKPKSFKEDFAAVLFQSLVQWHIRCWSW